jgi:hypothetical protein
MQKLFCDFFNQSGDLLNLLGMIGMATLTILIPIAIAIFGDDQDFETLDKNVILDHIIKAKNILIYIALIFIPLLIWGISPLWLRLFELLVWVIGIVYVLLILKDSYHWIKGNKFTARFNYLRKLKKPKDMEESWRSVWETQNINTQNEKEFFLIFSD